MPKPTEPHPLELSRECVSEGAPATISTSQPVAGCTIFAIPKPFVGDAERIQLNAIQSWRKLAPQVDILLLGDERGVAEFVSTAGEGSIRHLPGLRRNSSGTPMLDSAFEVAGRVCNTPLLMYCNCDVIFFEDLVRAIERLQALTIGEFIAFGRRTNLAVDRLINFADQDDVAQLQLLTKVRGSRESIVCKEYFIFRRGSFEKIPGFAVGRGNWDNWMIRSAKDRSLAVIDVSAMVTAVHQDHDYAHVGRNRWRCYVSGAEAKENERLAGGRGLIRGSTPDWILNHHGLRRVRCSGLCLPFWRDLPRFLRFLTKLVFHR
jgi:hypothetical protein